jgi:hypothetical protein
MSHVHLGEELALELALAEAPAARRAEAADARRAAAAACSECRERISAAELAVARLRARFDADVGPARIERIVERALAATTRSGQASPSGTSPWASRASRRWKASPALRWVAAAACLQLVLLPIWIARARNGPHTESVEVADARVARRLAPRETRAPTVAATPGDVTPSTDARHRRSDLEVQNALARDRLSLDRALRSPAFERTAAVRLPGEILACRVERWRGGDGCSRAPAASASGIEAVLWTDVLLDDYVRDAHTGAELAPLLSTCRRLAAGGRPEAELARLTVERAQRYGILSDDAPAARSGGTREREPTSADRDLLDPAWFRALSTAVSAASAAEDPTVRAWLALGTPNARAR